MVDLTETPVEGLSLSAQEVALHNLKTIDPLFNSLFFTHATEGWFEANPGTNYADLERMLRKEGLNTHVVCRKADETPMYDSAGKEWVIFYSCRPAVEAHKAVLTRATYKVNLKRLAVAGCLHVIGEAGASTRSSAKIQISAPSAQNIYSRIASNSVLINRG